MDDEVTDLEYKTNFNVTPAEAQNLVQLWSNTHNDLIKRWVTILTKEDEDE